MYQSQENVLVNILCTIVTIKNEFFVPLRLTNIQINSANWLLIKALQSGFALSVLKHFLKHCNALIYVLLFDKYFH